MAHVNRNQVDNALLQSLICLLSPTREFVFHAGARGHLRAATPDTQLLKRMSEVFYQAQEGSRRPLKQDDVFQPSMFPTIL